jgi:N-acetylglucosamine kinase-like BadF-type ATPase
LIYLGVDGGGTKTAFALIDQNGTVLAEHETGTCYHIEVGIDGAKKVLEQGVSSVLSKAKHTLDDIAYGFFGLPAYGEDSNLITSMDLLPAGLLAKSRYRCDNDMVNGWAAAFGGNDGINIVAGTGSIAYGVRQDKNARCGGWGELFSDEGSAYWIACKGLLAFTRMSDGRSVKGPLYDIIKAAYNIQLDFDITALVLSEWAGERSKVAQVSALVYQAAVAGDKDASAIFAQAGKELAEMVDGVRRSLDYDKNEVINVSYSGGVFNAGALILSPFSNTLALFSKQYCLQTAKHTPVVGAALYALKLSLLQD